MKNFSLGIYLMIWGCILGMAGSINLAGNIIAGIIVVVGILLMIYKEKKEKSSLIDFKRMPKSPEAHWDTYNELEKQVKAVSTKEQANSLYIKIANFQKDLHNSIIDIRLNYLFAFLDGFLKAKEND